MTRRLAAPHDREEEKVKGIFILHLHRSRSRRSGPDRLRRGRNVFEFDRAFRRSVRHVCPIRSGLELGGCRHAQSEAHREEEEEENRRRRTRMRTRTSTTTRPKKTWMCGRCGGGLLESFWGSFGRFGGVFWKGVWEVFGRLLKGKNQ